MSDLSGKFGAVGAQLSTQHGEIIEALGAIAGALGAPPTIPGTTLADVATLLTTINSNLVAMRAANALYFSSSLGLLGQINQNTDLIINNGSLNAQRVLAALMQLYCPCDGTAPLLPPPLDVTPISADDQAKCRRIQYFHDLWAKYIVRISNYVFSGAALSGRAIDDALQGVLLGEGITTGALAAVGGVPDAIRSTVVDQLANQIILDGRASVAQALIVLVDLEASDLIREALYSVDNAAAAKPAFDAAIAQAPVGNKIYEIGQTLFWSAWANDIYSAVPVVDDSAYDGTICAPAMECDWVTIVNNPNVTIDLSRALGYYWGDEGDGMACDITIGLNSGTPECKLFRDGVVISDWSAIPQHLVFSGSGHYEIRCDGTGSFSCLFKLCQAPV